MNKPHQDVDDDSWERVGDCSQEDPHDGGRTDDIPIQ